MANIDTLDSSVLVSPEVAVNGGEDVKGSEGSPKKVADEVAAGSKSSSPTKDTEPALPSPSSGLVPLRSSVTNGSSSGAPSGPTLSMPHPKKFSHSDINKRFLEKNSPASSASQTPASPSLNKPGSTIQKPVLQTASSHSRLVTAKLTAEGSRSTITGPGWSRPPSTSSSAGPPQPVGGAPSPGSTPGTTAPVPLPLGKIIQPQPRGMSESGHNRKDGTNLAWGAAKTAPPPPIALAKLSQDFPTAAEVAQVHSAKLLEKKQAEQEAEVHKETLAAEADAFRGVHLAPNAHHWDEDEGDDSNFLDEVIEFDDGRQYTIPHQAAEQTSDRLLPPKAEGGTQDRPVTKEERFAEDFDRSWPRSRGSNPPPPRVPAQLSPSRAPSVLLSPQDSSRVLFNERSNRLEPYSSHSQSRFGGPPRDANFPRRGSRSEYVSSPTDSRSGRDAPPHTQGLQLLQRSGPPGGPSDDGSQHHRGFGDHANYSSWNDNSRPRDRDPSRRDHADPAHTSRPFSQAFDHNHSRDHYPPGTDRPRRYSNMAAPPSEALSSDTESRDGRQLPPHLSGSHAPPTEWRSPSGSDRQRLPSLSADTPPTQAISAKSPAVSHVSLSPLHVETPLQATLPASPLVDIEEASKAAMHSAAERARLRRQHEEEEREKEKERARKKAAEIEARMKAAEAAKHPQPEKQEEPTSSRTAREAEAKAIEFIENAVGSLQSRPAEENAAPIVQRLGSVRTPSTRGGLRPAFMKRVSSGVNGNAPAVDEVDSWRTKSTSSRPSHFSDAHPPAPVPAPQPPAVPPPELTLTAEVESLGLEVDESLEVFDFADHGKMVGAHAEPDVVQLSEERAMVPTSRPPRPVAMDFFDDKQSALTITSEAEGSWRRRSSVASASAVESVDSQIQPAAKERPILEITPAPYEQSSSHWKGHGSSESLTRLSPDHASYNHGSVRSPTTPSYREAPMAALNDTMARIKGALDGMHHKVEPQKNWTQPPPREHPIHHDRQSSRYEHDDHIEHEVFDITASDPPKSPKPAWNNFFVRLPRISQQVEPVPQKKLRMFNAPYARLDVYSFVPPIEGMQRRDFNFNEYLFRKPFMSKGRIRYIVSLPGSGSAGNKLALKRVPPVVNLPINGRAPSSGAFGRPSEADGVTSWRKPVVNAAVSSAKPQRSNDELGSALDTVSRSPPPELPNQKIPEQQEASASVAVPGTAKPRTQPKLPQGSAVAFYRDSKVNSGESQQRPAVSFIVSSELEDDKSRLNGAPDHKETNGVLLMPQAAPPATSGLITTSQESAIIPESFASVNDPIVEFHKSSHSPIHAPITPRTQPGGLPWAKSPKDHSAKDVPSRIVDADRMKTVWSTTANQTDKSSATTLETFPTRETKAEVVAPHAHPSKMSLSDVTRSFQQVPTSAGGSNHLDSTRNNHPMSPPSLRQPSQLGQAQPPMMPAGMRPAYPGYPSPMMSSPSPNMMYAQAMAPSPIPRPMVPAGSPQYQPAPMWMPMPPPGVPGSMMRPMPSPYGAQLMPYPTAQMYAPPPMNMQGNSPAQSNGAQGRPPEMMMSPVAGQAQMAMYATSPVLMPAMPAMQGMPGGGYPGAGAVNGRGQQPQRGPYENVPGMMPPGSYGAQPPPAYSAAPPNSYVRSGW